jgi:DNA mismatch repair endonuclease MutH
MDNPFKYDDTSIPSILKYSKQFIGKSIQEIVNKSPYDYQTKKSDKGSIGKLIEKHGFGIEPNNSPEPDFPKAGLELKVIPLINRKRTITVKEKTKICSINFNELINENWIYSPAKKKLNKVLFIYYLYDKETMNSEIKKVDLWELDKNNNESLIKYDWLDIKKIVQDGYAHQLSERSNDTLVAGRSGSGGKDKFGKEKDLVFQPNQIYQKKALKRAFFLKRAFTNQRWDELKKVKFESIMESIVIKDFNNFEEIILNKINLYKNKSLKELSDLFNLDLNNASKNKEATIVKKAIGFKSVKSKIKEFEQLGIIVKTINVRIKDNKPFEGISFPSMKLKEFEIEKLEESTFKEYINKILFIPIYKEKDKVPLNKKYLGKAFFWSPSLEENRTINKEWEQYKNEVINGQCKVHKVTIKSKKGFKEVSELSKESETSIIHMRPHGRDSNDRDEDSLGNSIVKQCFWLNKIFIQKIIVNS